MPRMLTLPLLLLLALAGWAGRAHAQAIPLEACDGLPVVQATVAGAKFLFLVDTAANSMLNLKSFAYGDALNISVTSWNGTSETKAQKVTISDLVLGRNHLRNLELPAIDLTAIGRACGRKLDGILGIDLLRRLGAVLDLKDQTARLLVGTEPAIPPVAELDAHLANCEGALNRGDEDAFSDCLDPEVVLFTAAGDFYGRAATMQYFRQRYFRQHPRPQLAVTPRAHHLLGDAVWVEYDLRITDARQVTGARGSALCRKSDGKWRILHMNHSTPPAEPVAGEH